jgi:phosphonate transport system ATP-binding protein
LCSLHTLDAARQYCDRIIGMSKGRIVFDGVPTHLTLAVVSDIYQVEGHEAARPEEITSDGGRSIPPSQTAAAQS